MDRITGFGPVDGGSIPPGLMKYVNCSEDVPDGGLMLRKIIHDPFFKD